MRDSVVFYRSFAEAIESLEPADQLAALWAIINYGLDEIEPGNAGVAKAIFLMAKPQIDANNKRYASGTKGGRPKTKEEPNDNQTLTKAKPNINQTVTKPEPNDNVKENDNVNVNVEKENVKRKKFSPPARETVQEYVIQQGYSIDVERFMDYYTSNGWMVGRNVMQDWKAAVRNWARSKKEAGEPPKPGKCQFHSIPQRSYGEKLVNMEQQLLQKGR